jgi:hypothetical protein
MARSEPWITLGEPARLGSALSRDDRKIPAVLARTGIGALVNRHVVRFADVFDAAVAVEVRAPWANERIRQ